MKKLFATLIIILAVNLITIAQVGIGNTPKPKSILDLSNSNDKYLVMPKTTVDPFSLLTDTAAVIYYKGNIYMKTEDGIKVFTPWKWDGDSTHAISSPTQATVTIGMYPDVPVPYKLQVAGTSEITTAGNSPASIVVGEVNSNPSCPHVLIGSDEIMAKSNATTAGVLKIQEEEGTVEIRTSSPTTTNTVLTANGSINAAGNGSIKENGFDLVPSGTIVMWFGTCDISGYPLMAGVANTNWHICDGTAGTPDLRERFIVGAGGDNPLVLGTSGYSLNSTDGLNTVGLTINEMPTHDHPASSSTDGNHSHSTGSIPNCGEGYVAAYNGNNEVFDWDCTGAVTSSTDGNHSHTITVSDNGSGTAHENRPPFYALIYIMKL
ncbi:MAG: hypothetical protein A2W91_05325 [Bacteroidetes bacterium GWF2_38_335]|nr:MAG: hypothetical protein A2W91_05325 [Bacteroidetes bacterium GWF2_38_335]OFY79750.1 MAG: hypothetical protein A2281_10095 [Bacteroidetes bacterium RIFOXYA12_FULL_38_20]HBS88136.1 hypothetical protein [Bacteroidales bacterium]